MSDDIITTVRDAAIVLLEARESAMLTEAEWETLALAVHPPTPVPKGAAQRFLYDRAHGLVRLVEKDGATVLRQTALPDTLDAVAAFAESRTWVPFTIEGASEAEHFQFGREDAYAACEFLVHLGLAAHAPAGEYEPRGRGLAEKALAAMRALPTA